MRGKLHVIAGTLFVLAVLYDLYLWGGLARVPGLGPLMLEAAQQEVALAGIYLPIGLWLVDLAGVADSAASFASARFGALQPRLLENPAAAMDTLLSGMPMSVSLAYYGAPLLMVLTAILYWRRPRGVHMIGRR